jgi:hypothetical protein
MHISPDGDTAGSALVLLPCQQKEQPFVQKNFTILQDFAQKC